MCEKIIEITKCDTYNCLICGNKTESAKKINIKRPKYDDNIISFNVCDECIEQMKKDMESK